LVGFRYRTAWAVNEPSLHAAPRICETSFVAGGKRMKVECLNTILAFFQSGFPVTPATPCR
jgi:hypothetical protein